MEIFVPIEGFEGLYFISTHGRIWSEKYKGKILKPYDSQRGYLKIDLRKDGQRNTKYVHRIMAKMFIDNPNNYEEVDHKDRNGFNNKIENLRWVSPSINSRNKGVRSDSKSGIQGVCFRKERNLWVVQWKNSEKKRKWKYFSVRKYGKSAKEMAIEFRQKMTDKYYQRKI